MNSKRQHFRTGIFSRREILKDSHSEEHSAWGEMSILAVRSSALVIRKKHPFFRNTLSLLPGLHFIRKKNDFTPQTEVVFLLLFFCVKSKHDS